MACQTGFFSPAKTQPPKEPLQYRLMRLVLALSLLAIFAFA
jgi:hypothetical protein